jgi:hypothetical protein
MPDLDPNSPEGREWLKTDEGQAWLDSEDAIPWLVSGEGEDWLGSRDGRAWEEARQDEAWNDYIAGKKPPLALPDWALTPETAPRAGARVRLIEDATTLSGVQFSKGELGIVIETKFVPIGAVTVTIRMLDGRKLLTTTNKTFELAA